jgi:hypothetical protein
VHAPPAFHIRYATGWKGALLHYRWQAQPGEPEQAWQAVPMHSTASRATPLGGAWLTATVPAEAAPPRPRLAVGPAIPTNGHGNTNGHSNGHANGNGYSNGQGTAQASVANGGASGGSPALAPGGAPDDVSGLLMWDGAGGQQGAQGYRALEFFVSSADGSKQDRPLGGSTYRCPHPGGYKLLRGSLRPFPQATQAPLMLVSDLDGTMVGDGEEADAATRDFCTYWEDNAALAGGVLVYNTGRCARQLHGR